MAQDTNPQALLTEAQTASFLGLRPQTLAVWRCTHRYRLKYIRVGRAIRYRATDVERFLADRTVDTSEINSTDSSTK